MRIAVDIFGKMSWTGKIWWKRVTRAELIAVAMGVYRISNSTSVGTYTIFSDSKKHSPGVDWQIIEKHFVLWRPRFICLLLTKKNMNYTLCVSLYVDFHRNERADEEDKHEASHEWTVTCTWITTGFLSYSWFIHNYSKGVLFMLAGMFGRRCSWNQTLYWPLVFLQRSSSRGGFDSTTRKTHQLYSWILHFTREGSPSFLFLLLFLSFKKFMSLEALSDLRWKYTVTL